MTQQKGSDQNPDKSKDLFRTPKRPNSLATSRTSKSTNAKRTASPGVSTPVQASRRGSAPPTRAQSTLTQIDFVPRPTHPDDGELKYVEAAEPRGSTHEGHESEQLDNGSESDTDYRPPVRTRAGFTRFEMNDDHPKRRRKGDAVGNRIVGRGHSVRRSQTPKASASGKGKRKSVGPSATKRDKTLTQMDFVRRYITIDDSDDNDVNLGYLQPPSHDTDSAANAITKKEEQSLTVDSKTTKSEPTPAKRNRRVFEQDLDLSTGEPITSGDTQNTSIQDGQPSHLAPERLVLTPQKARKFEIPSSQSPESPGLAIITSSQFRGATHSHTKRKPLFLAPQVGAIKEESPDPRRVVEDSQDLEDTSQRKTPTRPPSKITKPSRRESPMSTNAAELASPTQHSASAEILADAQESKIRRSQKERTVIYETDAESNSSEDDEIEDGPKSPILASKSRKFVSDLVEQSPSLPSDDSQELPLPDTQPPADMGFDPPSELPMSDASAYYQRMQPATQFPLEPVPALNTQKLSELFPNEGNTQYLQPKPTHSSQNLPGPFLQSQLQGQDLDQTEMVPESSPAREQEKSVDKPDDGFQRPRAPGSVVQVESSQPVRRVDHGSGNILSRSQLLTSSVMESVALPYFCTGSQDSVGEPYSLPDH
ncbi:hypothetical protein N7532_008618 [Penicillium argentinense]|uniref:Uncharacterized protein n=1 Tax=Penicillium argentinense TaxID=1131581 RepID=A0A9W9EXY5_9EURO|nr:uncharacterized protein N7532_008618 [Penicillium argentinense]KAJ5089934.1 hypothetical protein N7532_008618 [Penicillium argentinense]